MSKRQPSVEESKGGPFSSPCWRCGETVPDVGYNVYLPKVLMNPVYHPKALGSNSCAPSDAYRWLCARCVRVEGYLW